MTILDMSISGVVIITVLPVKNEYAGNWLAQLNMKRVVAIRQPSRISTTLTYGIWRLFMNLLTVQLVFSILHLLIKYVIDVR